MDQDFFKQLEESFSNVGADECWKRDVGGRTVWFSPISVNGQAKVQDALVSKDLGANAINESKRITLCHAIVGIGDVDLREYRNSGPVFGPIPDPRDPKKKQMLDLAGYVYMKMATWGSQWLDDAFTVFADLMESHQKENVKNVKFENSKNPAEELGELMLRVTELRMQLGLPPLVEQERKPGDVDEVKEFERQMEEEARLAEEKEAQRSAREQEQQEEPPAVPFDPFKPVAPPAPDVRAAQPPRPVPEPVERPPAPPAPTPVVTVPVPVLAQPRAQGVAPRPIASFDEGGPPQSTAQTPFQAAPSVPHEVIEQQAPRVQTAPPVIDPLLAGRNPRFRPPSGG